MLGSFDQDEFVTRSIIAIITTLRRDGSPSSSMVSFARRGDHLFFTTTMERAKGKMLANDPRVTITIVNPHEPWSFVTVDGKVIIHRDNPPELQQLILDGADHPDYPWPRTDIEQMISAPGRAIFELVSNRVSGVVMPRT